MATFASRFSFWQLFVALASLCFASPQSGSRPSQLYGTPRRPQVFPTQVPQSRPPVPQIPTVPPPPSINLPPILPQDQVLTQGTRPIGSTNVPSVPSRPQPNRLYTQPDPAGSIGSQFVRPDLPSNDGFGSSSLSPASAVPPGAVYGIPAPIPPQTPSQLYVQPAGDASDDRRGSVVFPTPSDFQGDDFPAPPAPRPFPEERPQPPAPLPSTPRPTPTPTGTSSAMMGMPYDFDWDVQDAESGNIFSHTESSDGTVTRGEYRVLLPDGRLQIVQFVDRGNGYEAKVSYEIYDGKLRPDF